MKDQNNWLLWGRFALLNIFGFVALYLAHLNGWITQIVTGDTSGISVGIFCFFLIGLFLTGVRVHKLTKEINDIRSGSSSRLRQYAQLVKTKGQEVASQVTQIRLFSKIQWISRIGNSLVVLGLIGTVLGAIQFLLGVDVQALQDVSRVGLAFEVILQGMGVALYTTLVGAITNLWLTFNYGIVETGTANLVAALMDHSEE